MNTRALSSLTSACCILLLGVALVDAQESAPAPARPQCAFFGVYVRPLPPEVRAQLDLPENQGLMVGGLETEGPAASVGIKTYDVLTHFNDQMLLSADQFVRLVRGSEPGAKVEVTWRHKGVEKKASLNLGSVDDVPHPVPPHQAAMELANQFDLEKIRQQVEQSLADQPQLRETILELLLGSHGQRPEQLLEEASCVRHQDESGTVEITLGNGSHHARVTDPQGRILFEGPTNTPEERQKIPPELRAKIQSVEEMMGP